MFKAGAQPLVYTAALRNDVPLDTGAGPVDAQREARRRSSVAEVVRRGHLFEPAYALGSTILDVVASGVDGKLSFSHDRQGQVSRGAAP